MEPVVRKAHEFAAKAHAGVVRRWSGEPYVEHCERVAGSLIALGAPAEVVAAAYLHDVIEDCPVSEAELAAAFGPKVAALVVEVTNPKIAKTPGNRPERKAAVIRHLAASSPEGASIKLADMLDNSSNVAEHDPEFAKRYLAEMAKKLAVLGHGHPALVAELKRNLANYLI
jgi:(p)ppGpp synthase/HD superfamily hydrolase